MYHHELRVKAQVYSYFNSSANCDWKFYYSRFWF